MSKEIAKKCVNLKKTYDCKASIIFKHSYEIKKIVYFQNGQHSRRSSNSQKFTLIPDQGRKFEHVSTNEKRQPIHKVSDVTLCKKRTINIQIKKSQRIKRLFVGKL